MATKKGNTSSSSQASASSSSRKLASREALVPILAGYRAEKKRIGYTSGVFDILHPGHVAYLEASRAACDVLVVGINSDRSVRSNKGPERPVNGESDRARVVAGLASVDHVFVFDEENNNRNVETLKPDVYLKAGDYDRSKLSSAPLVEAYGGSVILVPFSEGYSTTGILAKTKRNAGGVELSIPPYPRRAAVFVDRDGTINEMVEYLHEPEKLKIFPGALAALKRMKNLGYRVVIITNQPGIGLGYFTKEDLFAVNRAMLYQATKEGLDIDRIYFCPHGKADNCGCRKPGTALIERAKRDLNLDLAHSFVIGDMTSDVKLAERAGCRSILVATGRGGDDGLFDVTPGYRVPDLAKAAELLESLPRPPMQLASPDDVPAENTLEALGQMAAKFGHDFNNLLAAIQACVELIAHRMTTLHPDKNPIENQLKVIHSAIQRASGITNRLRAFVRPGTPRVEPVSLVQCLESVVDLLNKVEKGSFDVTLQIGKELFAVVNEYQLVQTLLGICMNALDAMRKLKDRHLVIHLAEVDGGKSDLEGLKPITYARISIVDHGTGIPAEVKEHLFEPFFSTKAGIGHGFGLGLAMARATIEKYGGKLSLQTAADVGTVVHVYVPTASMPRH